MPPPVAVRLIEGVLQSIIEIPVLFKIAALGVVLFEVIDMLADELQPFNPVTVTTYTPGAVRV